MQVLKSFSDKNQTDQEFSNLCSLSLGDHFLGLPPCDRVLHAQEEWQCSKECYILQVTMKSVSGINIQTKNRTMKPKTMTI